MKKLLIGIAIITFLSCEQPATSPQDSDCIEISFNNAKSVNFLDAFEIVKVVPLQTIEKSLITRISKIIIHDGDFFLFNTNMNDPVFKEVLHLTAQVSLLVN